MNLENKDAFALGLNITSKLLLITTLVGLFLLIGIALATISNGIKNSYSIDPHLLDGIHSSPNGLSIELQSRNGLLRVLINNTYYSELRNPSNINYKVKVTNRFNYSKGFKSATMNHRVLVVDNWFTSDKDVVLANLKKVMPVILTALNKAKLYPNIKNEFNKGLSSNWLAVYNSSTDNCSVYNDFRSNYKSSFTRNFKQNSYTRFNL